MFSLQPRTVSYPLPMSEERERMAGPNSNERGDASNSKYKGVRKRKWGKWVSEIRLPNSRERIWLGSYDSAEKAARAFDAAQFCLRGRNARFNFPDDPPNIAGGRDLAPTEIQVAAARFANSAPEPPPSSGPVRAGCLVPRTESPSASEGTVAGMDHDFGMYTDVSIYDPSRYGGGSSIYCEPDYGIFPGFDDLNNDYFGTQVMNGSHYGEENYDGVLAQDFRLWNF